MSRTNPNRHVKAQVISKFPSGFHLTHGGVQKSFEGLVEGFAPTALLLTTTAIVTYFDGFQTPKPRPLFAAGLMTSAS